MTATDNIAEKGTKPIAILFGLWNLLLAMLLWIVCLSWYYLPVSSAAIEQHYSKGFYRVVVATITTITGNVPFSVVIVLVGVAPILFVLRWAVVWIIRRKVHKQPHWKCLVWGFEWLFLFLPVVWLWFLLFWGIGYQREPLEKRLNFSSIAISDEEIAHIGDCLLEIIHNDQPATPSDRDVGRAVASVSRSMQKIVLDWDKMPIRLPDRVKATPPGLFLMNGTSGMCVPLTLEPHVDGGLPDSAFVAVAAHELGHITGLCDEGETNLIGYAAGLAADDPYARYAVALGIYRSISRHYSGGPEAALAKLPQQAQDDLKRASEASRRYRIQWLQQWSWRAYNHYLKAQGVQDGVQSYGRGTELLVRAWRAGHVALPEFSAASETE
jgi:hypothetical protein